MHESKDQPPTSAASVESSVESSRALRLPTISIAGDALISSPISSPAISTSDRTAFFDAGSNFLRPTDHMVAMSVPLVSTSRREPFDSDSTQSRSMWEAGDHNAVPSFSGLGRGEVPLRTRIFRGRGGPGGWTGRGGNGGAVVESIHSHTPSLPGYASSSASFSAPDILQPPHYQPRESEVPDGWNVGGQSTRALADPHVPPTTLGLPGTHSAAQPFVFNLRRPTTLVSSEQSSEQTRVHHSLPPALDGEHLQPPHTQNTTHHPDMLPTRMSTDTNASSTTHRTQGERPHEPREILNADPWRDYDTVSGYSGLRQRLGASGSRIFSRDEAVEQAQIAKEAPPLNFQDLVQIYTVVSDRRSSFDNLLWQVPTMGLTAHAFLFSIALASDTSKAARIISSALSILITFMTLHLFTRQLQAEDADNRWLADFEKRHHMDEIDCAHGDAWGKYRSQLPARARHFKYLAKLRGFTVWSNGLLAIGAAAVLVMLIAIFEDSLLIGCSCGNGGGSSTGSGHFTCPNRNK